MQTRTLNNTTRNFEQLPNCALVSIAVLCELFESSEATIWRRVKDNTIPKPKRFGPRSVRWAVSDIRAILEA